MENHGIGKQIAGAIKEVFTEDNIKNYILGTKKNGSPRAIYDVIKESREPACEKKRKKKHKGGSSYDLYLGVKKKGKKKGKKKHNKQWYID